MKFLFLSLCITSLTFAQSPYIDQPVSIFPDLTETSSFSLIGKTNSKDCYITIDLRTNGESYSYSFEYSTEKDPKRRTAKNTKGGNLWAAREIVTDSAEELHFIDYGSAQYIPDVKWWVKADPISHKVTSISYDVGWHNPKHTCKIN